MATKSVLGGDYSLDERTDEQLVDLARSGGSRTGAWDELYRRHAGAARSVARHLMQSRNDADDVVNDAFAGVIAAIGRGAGPRTNFRNYLMACVRNGCNQRVLASSRTVNTDPSGLDQRHTGVFEDAEQFGESGVVAAAFSSLSADCQRALWMTAVEQRTAEFISRELRRRPTVVTTLTNRSREAFTEAYLREHQQRLSAPSCERVSAKLAHFIRGKAGDVDTARVEHHLAQCADCTRAVEELRKPDASLRSLASPASIVGSAATVEGAAPTAGVRNGLGLVGRTATFCGKVSLAKVAVLAALVVPTVILANESSRSDGTLRDPPSALAAEADAAESPERDASVHPEPLADLGSSTTLASLPPVDPTVAVGAGLTPAGVTPSTFAASVTAPSGPGGPGAGGRSTPVVTTHSPVVTQPSRPPEELDAGQAAWLSPAPQSPTTITNVAIPQTSVAPSIASPVVSVATVAAPVVTSPAPSTTEVSNPAIAVPAVTIAPVVVPSATVPSVTVAPSVVVAPTVVQVVASEPIAVTPLTIAELPLPSLPPLPLPKLSNLFDSGNES